MVCSVSCLLLGKSFAAELGISKGALGFLRKTEAKSGGGIALSDSRARADKAGDQGELLAAVGCGGRHQLEIRLRFGSLPEMPGYHRPFHLPEGFGNGFAIVGQQDQGIPGL